MKALLLTEFLVLQTSGTLVLVKKSEALVRGFVEDSNIDFLYSIYLLSDK